LKGFGKLAKITNIEEQKRKKDRVNIYVDNVFFAGVFKELAHALKLEIDKEVDKDELKQIIDEEMYYEAKEKALQIINHSPHSEKALKEKLGKRGYENAICLKVIKWLKEYGFLNDEKFANALAKDKANLSKHGKKRIKQTLYQKKFNKELIEEVIENIDEETEYQNALELAQKKAEKLKSKESDRRKLYQKISQYLAYRGYGYNIIGKVVKQVLA
jgi:regulatory protein